MNPNLEYVWDEDDWDVYKAIFSRKLRQDYSVDISGQANGGKTAYFFSGGYLDDQGYGNRQYYKRYSFRTNLSTELFDWWKVAGSLSYSRHRQNLSAYQVFSSCWYGSAFFGFLTALSEVPQPPRKLIRGFSDLPRLVVIITTPFAAREP